MADERSPGGRPSWRGKAEPERRERPARAEKSSHRWSERAERPAADAAASGSRSIRMLAGLLSFAACLGAVIWLIWMINPPRPAGVVLLGADYAANLAVPHNIAGYRGLEAIEGLSRAPRPWALFNPAQLQLFHEPTGRHVLEKAEDWDATIAALKKGFREPTLILVLALHGGSDASGAYLMPNGMKRPEDRLDMRKVIASMKELPPEKAKILVVEGAQVASDWRLGMLHNDFPRRLKALEPEIRAVPNLWVLSGCDVDQRCWASEGLGRTVFLHYIIEALRRGSAAGSDGRLSLDELYHYVRDNVRGWAWAARGAVQEPVLLPDPAPGGDGGHGDGPERRDPALVHLATVEAAAPVEAPPPPDRDAISRAWLAHRRLDRMVPHPSTYSPLRWRSYGAALLRYEQLLLAGAAEAAEPVAQQLARLERAIRGSQSLNAVGASAGANLVMDALDGGSAGRAGDAQEFLKIAQAPDDPRAQKIWESLRDREAAAAVVDDGGGAVVRPLRIRLVEYLLRRAQGERTRDTLIAADRIRLAVAAGEPLPAEGHFLRMLRTGLSPPLESRRAAFATLPPRAVRVRMLAERAAMGAVVAGGKYPYSERVHAWTGPMVEEADARRRDGEDRLFADDEAAWEQAGRDLTAAEAGYNRALDLAGRVQPALAVRDRAFAALPDYSRWLVHRQAGAPAEPLDRRVEALWAGAHDLARMLDDPAADPAKLDVAARALDDGLAELVRTFIAESDDIARDRRVGDWEAEGAAAAVPFPDDEKLTRRTAIWDRLERIRLHDAEIARSAAPLPSSAETPDPAHAADPARRAAVEGVLALSALGETWFGAPDFKDADQSDYRKTLDRLRAVSAQAASASASASPSASTAAGPWWEEVARQGDRIGVRFRALPGKVDALADEERGLTGLASRLADADRLARLVDRGDEPPADAAVEPSSRLRRLRAHDLLVWMAERAGLDHWYDEKPEAPPYYLGVVARLFDEARGLFPALDEADRKRRDRLTAPARLAFDAPERLVLTSEIHATAPFRVVDAKGAGMAAVPPGIPVVCPRPDGAIRLDNPSAGYRAAARGDRPAAAFRFGSPAVVLAESRADGFAGLLDGPGRAASLNIDGFFRGQVFRHGTEVDIQAVPDAVAIGPAPADPPLASIAVRAGEDIIRRFGEGTGSIAIVLDCSGSMRNDGDRSKWPNAKAALKQVLTESVPPGTRLSLWTFSQLAPGIPFNERGDMVNYSREQLDRARADDAAPERTIHCQRRMAAWSPAQVNDVGALLDRLDPYHETPLVEAMWKAASSDLFAGEGLKNLLVLTDGADNRFDRSTELNPGNRLTIPAFLRERFRGKGIRITVVYFRSAGLAPKAQQAEQEQVRRARQNFEEPLRGLEVPGQFVEATDLDQLISRLRAGLRQELVCQVFEADGRLAGPEPLAVTRSKKDSLRWWGAGLKTGYYTLRVLAHRPFDQIVGLGQGDRLVVELIDDRKGGIAFRRALYGDEDEFRDFRADPGAPTSGGWRLSILGENAVGERPAGLAVMAAIESTRTTAERLGQERPRWAAFRLVPDGRKGPSSALPLRWRERLTYPGPVWQLDAPRWPVDPADATVAARPILTAWWWGSADSGPLPCEAEFEPDPAGLPFDVSLPDGRSVRVEDFALEEHYVEVKPGETPRPRPCLVIRLAAGDGAYFIDPEPLRAIDGAAPIAGHEHRHYGRAGKYAGLFWPVIADQFNVLRKARFRLISVDRLRAEAERLGQTARIPLERPRDDVRFPEPPRAIGP